MTDSRRCRKCNADLEITFTQRICQGCGQEETECGCAGGIKGEHEMFENAWKIKNLEDETRDLKQKIYDLQWKLELLTRTLGYQYVSVPPSSEYQKVVPQ